MLGDYSQPCTQGLLLEMLSELNTCDGWGPGESNPGPPTCKEGSISISLGALSKQLLLRSFIPWSKLMMHQKTTECYSEFSVYPKPVICENSCFIALILPVELHSDPFPAVFVVSFFLCLSSLDLLSTRLRLDWAFSPSILCHACCDLKAATDNM